MTMKKWLCVLCALLFPAGGLFPAAGVERGLPWRNSSSRRNLRRKGTVLLEFDLPENHDMDPAAPTASRGAGGLVGLCYESQPKMGSLWMNFIKRVMMKPAFSRFALPVPNPLLGPLSRP